MSEKGCYFMGLRRLVTSVLFVALLLSTSVMTAAAASPMDRSDPDSIAATVNRLAPVAGSARVSTLKAADGSFAATAGDKSFSIPRDSNGRVVLDRSGSGGGNRIGLSLPNAGTSANARFATDGTATFTGGSDGAAVAVQASRDGIRILTVLDSVSAPTEYRYIVDLPSGAKMTPLETGGIVITRADGSFLGGFAPAWAKDSTGATVATRYEVDGDTVVQVVEHRQPSVHYPVVADPYFFIDLIDHATWVWHNEGWTLQVSPTSWARANGGSYPVGVFGWDELYSKYRNRGLNTNLNGMRDQFICHQQFAFWKNTWNLDEWRPNVGYAQTVAQLCNPGGAKWFD